MRGEDLGRLREAKGHSQVELAELLGVSRRTMQNWEGQGVPRKDRARVAAFFGVPEEQPEADVEPGPAEPDDSVARLLREHGLPDVLESLARVVAREEPRSE
jgi:transcriptional regulator with XRE-family HTH domain